MIESAFLTLLFVGLLLSVTGTDTSCPLELSPPSVVVKYGDPVSINCSTSETLFEGIGWEVTHGATGLQPVNHLTWSLDSVTHWSISPTCFITPFDNSTFKQCFQGPEFVVYTFPDAINISSNADWGGRVNELEEYDYICDIPNVAPVQRLTVKWYKGDELLKTQTFNNPSKEPVNESSVLNFNATRQDNGVALRCEAHLDLGPSLQLNVSSQEYIITVKYGPELHCSADWFLEGETIEEKCQVTGNPTPFVKWTKNKQPIDPNLPLSRENTGLYVVEAEGASSIEEKVKVLVYYGPELSCPSTYTVLEYSTHNLTCNVTGFPKPEIIWSKDGEDVDLPDNLTRRDAGQYIVTASNKHSTFNFSVDITVQYPPSPIVELEDSEVDVGSSVWLKCSSTGNPRPKYSWDYYRADNVVEKNEDGVSYLIIESSTAHNMGLYKCHAWNGIGRVSRTARVTVKGQLVSSYCPIEMAPAVASVRFGDPFSAICKSLSNQTEGMGWESPLGSTQLTEGVTSVDLKIDSVTQWEFTPQCYINEQSDGSDQKQCFTGLPVTVYQTPSVSIPEPGGPMVADQTYSVQCDIVNVAPVRNLKVLWYINDKEESTDTFGEETKTPVNKSSVLKLTARRKHNGARIWCKPKLDFGSTGPLPSIAPAFVEAVVLYPPTFMDPANETHEIPAGKEMILNCTARGNPPPKYSWYFPQDTQQGNKIQNEDQSILTSPFEVPGTYKCTASNAQGTTIKFFDVTEAKRNRTTFAALLGGFVSLGVLLVVAGLFFVKPDGFFAFNKSSYLKGKPSSGPV